MNILVHRSKVKPYNSRNEKDIFKALWLFNLISKLLMSAPFTVSGPVDQRKFTPIRHNDINYFVRCSITLCAGFYAISQFMMHGVKLRFTQGALNCLTMTVIIIWTFLKKNEIVKLLRKFEKKEKRFKEIGIVYSYTRLRNVSIVEISSVFLIICAIYILVLDEYEDSREILMFLLFILPNIIIMLYVCQYINYVLILNDWLKNLHIYIERMYYSDSDIEMRLSYARQTFYSIWKLSDMVQKYFQFPVLCINATSFLNITAFLYRWLISTHVHLSTFFWIGANLLKLFILPFLCELCCNKVLNQSIPVYFNIKYIRYEL